VRFGANEVTPETAVPHPTDVMRLACPVLETSRSIPVRCAGAQIPGGANVSLPLSWSGVPPATASFVLTVIDHHPIARRWVHWVVVDLPGDLIALPEGASMRPGVMPAGCIELENSFGTRGYGGPQPPPRTGPHEYVITLYALAVPSLALDARATIFACQAAMKGRLISTAEVAGVFER
jgi:Raf kinase inhibitor-like YbhB/YbcL family protein